MYETPPKETWELYSTIVSPKIWIFYVASMLPIAHNKKCFSKIAVFKINVFRVCIFKIKEK